ncbi:unnamed protein product [Oppiella nova]|uniref:EF-hand domain-containing protein n=1 Tax=Oppiella nova TaxID=334625 RepID=A0A7R9QMB5_9ACAR|nr:unnamed protein product [Oppiella nova]CAG2168132.1 unnamed protein product [Oppiella nova]
MPISSSPTPSPRRLIWSCCHRGKGSYSSTEMVSTLSWETRSHTSCSSTPTATERSTSKSSSKECLNSVLRATKNQSLVAFRIYDMDNDGFISNGELFQVLKMMVGNNLKDTQLQQIVDKTIVFADKDEDGKISFEEFCSLRAETVGIVVGNTDIHKKMVVDV